MFLHLYPASAGKYVLVEGQKWERNMFNAEHWHFTWSLHFHWVAVPCPFHFRKVSFNKTLIILCLHFRAPSSEDKRHLNTIQLEICIVLIKQKLEIVSLIPGFISSNQSRSQANNEGCNIFVPINPTETRCSAAPSTRWRSWFLLREAIWIYFCVKDNI